MAVIGETDVGRPKRGKKKNNFLSRVKDYKNHSQKNLKQKDELVTFYYLWINKFFICISV